MGGAATLRKYSLVLFVILMSFGLSGCWDRKEINDLGIVTGIGIDRTQNQETELTLQFYSPLSTSGQSAVEGKGASSSGTSVTRVGRGKNMADAASRMQESSSRHYFWGHSQVLLIGEKFARSGMDEPLEFMTRHTEPPERINVFIATGDLKQLLQWRPNVERDSAVFLQEIGNLNHALQITLLDWFKQSQKEPSAIILPMVGMGTAGKGQQFPKIVGTAILKNNRLVATMNTAQARGFRWIVNQLKEATITMDAEGKPRQTISVKFHHIHTSLKPKVEGGKWSMEIGIKAVGLVIENNSVIDATKPEGVKKLEQMAEQEIRQRVMGVITPAQQEWNADVFGFSSVFRQKYPRIWKQNVARWDEIFPQIQINVKIALSINHSGLTNKNANA